MRKLIFCVLLFFGWTNLYAIGNNADSLYRTRLNYQEINFLHNLYYGSSNPVSLTFNTVQTLTSVNINTHRLTGKLRAVDAAERHNDFSADISGLKRAGHFFLSGGITYLNAKDDHHKWNSTLMLSPINPFIIGDSISSDVSLEQFSLFMGAAYSFNRRISVALRMKYKTGSSSDQTDPRPKTNSMHFIVNPGFWYRLSMHHNVGVSLNADVYHSDISFAVVNTLEDSNYFLMKGMGDYTVFSTSDNISYPRNYKGCKYGGDIQWEWSANELHNLLEIGSWGLKQNAEDGGSAYTYKGGDFQARQIHLYDRFTFCSNVRLKQNLILCGDYTNGYGYWYDQQREVDTQHGNLVYYKILNKSKIHDAAYINASVEYKIDKIGLQSNSLIWKGNIKAGFNKTDEKHYEARTSEQNYTLGFVSVGSTRYWNISDLRLSATLGAAFNTTLGHPDYDTVRGKLKEIYVDPQFEYFTSSKMGLDGRLALDIPLRLYHAPVWLTVYGQASGLFYLGNNKYTDRFDSTSRTTIDFGLSLTL
ncbi:MAG: hypothetical protein LKF48_06755 [Prevotella sp.]|jgi:hypothetical protein|nr:hypothetical protein [Prevotella sp.]MCH4211487.1 hypothetical protein [Prevotella sp.]MCH4240791.1 hypothetical protein [Prevotella sp.]